MPGHPDHPNCRCLVRVRAGGVVREVGDTLTLDPDDAEALLAKGAIEVADEAPAKQAKAKAAPEVAPDAGT